MVDDDILLKLVVDFVVETLLKELFVVIGTEDMLELVDDFVSP